jgi:hypothetical protein
MRLVHVRVNEKHHEFYAYKKGIGAIYDKDKEAVWLILVYDNKFTTPPLKYLWDDITLEIVLETSEEFDEKRP